MRLSPRNQDQDQDHENQDQVQVQENPPTPTIEDLETFLAEARLVGHFVDSSSFRMNAVYPAAGGTNTVPLSSASSRSNSCDNTDNQGGDGCGQLRVASFIMKRRV